MRRVTQFRRCYNNITYYIIICYNTGRAHWIKYIHRVSTLETSGCGKSKKQVLCNSGPLSIRLRFFKSGEQDHFIPSIRSLPPNYKTKRKEHTEGFRHMLRDEVGHTVQGWNPDDLIFNLVCLVTFEHHHQFARGGDVDRRLLQVE